MSQSSVMPSMMQRPAVKTASVAVFNPLVDEIARALLDLGGAAHRDVVVAYVGQKRGWYRPPEGLKRDLCAAFDTYCGGASDPRARAAASALRSPERPLGPDGSRLSDDAVR